MNGSACACVRESCLDWNFAGNHESDKLPQNVAAWPQQVTLSKNFVGDVAAS